MVSITIALQCSDPYGECSANSTSRSTALVPKPKPLYSGIVKKVEIVMIVLSSLAISGCGGVASDASEMCPKCFVSFKFNGLEYSFYTIPFSRDLDLSANYHVSQEAS